MKLTRILLVVVLSLSVLAMGVIAFASDTRPPVSQYQIEAIPTASYAVWADTMVQAPGNSKQTQPMIMEGAGTWFIAEWDTLIGNNTAGQLIDMFEIGNTTGGSVRSVGCLYGGPSGSYKVRFGFYDDDAGADKYWHEMNCPAGVYVDYTLATVLDDNDNIRAWAWSIPNGQPLYLAAYGTTFKTTQGPH